MTTDFQTFVRAYVECALWASTDEDGSPLDYRFDVDDVANLTDVKRECASFVRSNLDTLATFCEAFDAEYAGHDFFLTRNRHGVGYWDRTFAPGALRDACLALTDDAHAHGEDTPYVGDDGRVYFGPC
jgi:hypothetical protein